MAFTFPPLESIYVGVRVRRDRSFGKVMKIEEELQAREGSKNQETI